MPPVQKCSGKCGKHYAGIFDIKIKVCLGTFLKSSLLFELATNPEIVHTHESIFFFNIQINNM